MKTYLLSLLTASLIAAMVGILAPEGERGGLAKHLRLLTSLFLVCVLIAPLGTAITGLRELLNGSIDLPGLESPGEDPYREQMEEALQSASTGYFTQMLTRMLESEFSIATGDVRCVVEWQGEEDSLSPRRVTVILSGKAIWKDPQAIEDFVCELLGCPCVSAIE